MKFRYTFADIHHSIFGKQIIKIENRLPRYKFKKWIELYIYAVAIFMSYLDDINRLLNYLKMKLTALQKRLY